MYVLLMSAHLLLHTHTHTHTHTHYICYVHCTCTLMYLLSLTCDRVKHRNIVELYELFDSKSKLYLVMEL